MARSALRAVIALMALSLTASVYASPEARDSQDTLRGLTRDGSPRANPEYLERAAWLEECARLEVEAQKRLRGELTTLRTQVNALRFRASFRPERVELLDRAGKLEARLPRVEATIADHGYRAIEYRAYAKALRARAARHAIANGRGAPWSPPLYLPAAWELPYARKGPGAAVALEPLYL